MVISTRINQLLAPMGLKLQRVPTSPPLNSKPSRSAGHQVELMGPSGVGKSYFYGQLGYQLRGDWLSRTQIKQHAFHGRYSFTELEAKDSTLMEYLLRKKHEAIWNRSIPLWRKHRLYKFYADTLAIDGYARELCLPTRGVFLDDGVQHNYGRELLDWYTHHVSHSADDMQRLEDFMKGRSLILVDAPVEHIMSNLKKRHAQLQGKRQNDWLAWMTEEDTLAMISNQKERKQHWFKVAKALGTATLELDVREELSTNERKVVDFLESIQSEQGSKH